MFIMENKFNFSLKTFLPRILITRIIFFFFILVCFLSIIYNLINSKSENLLAFSIILSIVFSLIIFRIFISTFFWKNTNYYSYENKFISDSNFFYENKSLIPKKNIIHINYHISFLWDRIFNTGTIKFYTSGSSTSNLEFYFIKNVKEVFDNLIQNIFNKKNFDDLKKIIRPNIFIGFIFFVVSIFFTLGFFFGVLLIPLILKSQSIIFYLILFMIVIILLSLVAFFHFKKLKYFFYEDILVYYDGFLSLNKVALPYNKITNISLEKILVERLFNVGRILIETAGASSPEIMILFVENPEEVLDNLKQIVFNKKNI